MARTLLLLRMRTRFSLACPLHTAVSLELLIAMECALGAFQHLREGKLNRVPNETTQDPTNSHRPHRNVIQVAMNSIKLLL